ncbi:hypothetical protein RYX36_035391 [Vicia faba]
MASQQVWLMRAMYLNGMSPSLVHLILSIYSDGTVCISILHHPGDAGYEDSDGS